MRSIFVYEYVSGGGVLPVAARVEDWLEAGLLMRDAVVADLLRIPDLAVTCATSTREAHPPGAKAKAAAFACQTVTPRADVPALTFVRRMARDHDLSWIIAPEAGGLLARLHEAVGERRWIGCDAQAIALASSKPHTLAALAARGVATPLAFASACDTGDAPASAGRWIVKPSDGAGAVNTLVHTRREDAQADLDQRLAAGEAATLEPFVEGVALSLSLLVGPDQWRVLSLNRQHIGIDPQGRLSLVGVDIVTLDIRDDPRSQPLQDVAAAVVATIPGLRGFVGVDLVWHEHVGPVVIEVNPRITSAYAGLSARLQGNLAEEILSWHQPQRSGHG